MVAVNPKKRQHSFVATKLWKNSVAIFLSFSSIFWNRTDHTCCKCSEVRDQSTPAVRDYLSIHRPSSACRSPWAMPFLKDKECFPWSEKHEHNEQKGNVEIKEVGWRRIPELFSTSDLENLAAAGMPGRGFSGRLENSVGQPTSLSQRRIQSQVGCQWTDSDHDYYLCPSSADLVPFGVEPRPFARDGKSLGGTLRGGLMLVSTAYTVTIITSLPQILILPVFSRYTSWNNGTACFAFLEVELW